MSFYRQIYIFVLDVMFLERHWWRSSRLMLSRNSLNPLGIEKPCCHLKCPRYLWLANILTLYRMERLRMVSTGLETLKNIRNIIYLSQKVNFKILFKWALTSPINISIVLLRHVCKNCVTCVKIVWRVQKLEN